MSDIQSGLDGGSASALAELNAKLAELKAAIALRASGRQVLDVQSGDRRMRYADTPLKEMHAELDRIERAIAAFSFQSGRPRPARAFRGTIGSGY